MTKRHDPDNYCPICGAYWRFGHQCDKKAIAALDAVNERGSDEDDGRAYGDRIEQGFDMLRDNYDGVTEPIDEVADDQED